MRQMRVFYLASASPRRQELLDAWGLSYHIITPKIDETLRTEEAPAQGVLRLAHAKAAAAQASQNYMNNKGLILAGDTLVSLNEQPLGKPGNPDTCKKMLSKLSGKTHQVFSAYCLLETTSKRMVSKVVKTDVHIRQLSAEWLEWYSQLPEGHDKAGGYALQGIGAAMVEWIHGSYTNVVGFPMEQIIWDLLAHGWLSLMGGGQQH